MVISYSITELTAIGEAVTLKECLAATANNNNDFHLNNNNSNHQQQLNHSLNLINSLYCQLNNQINNCQQSYQNEQSSHSPDSSEFKDTEKPLAQSVANFFKLAQHNFYKTIIDPTKVRSLSDVEAELLSSNSLKL